MICVLTLVVVFVKVLKFSFQLVENKRAVEIIFSSLENPIPLISRGHFLKNCAISERTVVIVFDYFGFYNLEPYILLIIMDILGDCSPFNRILNIREYKKERWFTTTILSIMLKPHFISRLGILVPTKWMPTCKTHLWSISIYRYYIIKKLPINFGPKCQRNNFISFIYCKCIFRKPFLIPLYMLVNYLLFHSIPLRQVSS